MAGYTVTVRDRNDEAVLPEGDTLTFTPLRWSAAAQGGPEAALVEVRGPRSALLMLMTWLRYGLRIDSPGGAPLWWGYVHAVEVHSGGLAVGATLDGMVNRVAVIYRQQGGNGATVTQWLEDAISIAEYGYREQILSMGEATPEMADVRRNLRGKYAQPQPVRAFDVDGGVAWALLECRGWAATLAWRYMQRTDGRIEWLGEGQQLHPIGWKIAGSALIGFGPNGVYDDSGRLGSLREGHRITIAGGANSGLTLTIRQRARVLSIGGDDVGVVEIASNGIYFGAPKDILSVADDLDVIESGTWLRVSGSAGNSRTHWLKTAGADRLVTDTSVSGSIVSEGAGPAIVLHQGQTADVIEATTQASPGASIDITLRGYRVAQSFAVGAAMDVQRVAIKARTVGAPADGLTVQICADASGNPGSVLATATAAAAGLPPDSVDWVWLTFAPTALGAGTYWLVVQRSGALSATAYYELGMTETAHDSTRQYTGSGWEAHTPGWSLPYQVWSAEDLGAQLRVVLDRTAQFAAGMDYALNLGIVSNPTMEQRATGWDAALRLMEIGTSTGERVLLHVTPERVFQVQKAEAASGNKNILWADGGVLRVTDVVGAPWDEGVLPQGMWLNLGALMSESPALTQGITPAYVERAEFDASTGALTVEFAGAKTLADALKVQQG